MPRSLEDIVQAAADDVQLESGAAQVIVIAFDARDGGTLAMGARVTHPLIISKLLQKVMAEAERRDLTIDEDL